MPDRLSILIKNNVSVFGFKDVLLRYLVVVNNERETVLNIQKITAILTVVVPLIFYLLELTL